MELWQQQPSFIFLKNIHYNFLVSDLCILLFPTEGLQLCIFVLLNFGVYYSFDLGEAQRERKEEGESRKWRSRRIVIKGAEEGRGGEKYSSIPGIRT